MEQHVLGKRQKALEEEFFRRRDAALLEHRRVEAARQQARAALAAASRITDEDLLDELVAMGIDADTLVALSLIPLAEVAWADGRIDAAEKRAVLEATRAAGLEPQRAGHHLVESCLTARPPKALRGLWRSYIESLCAALSAEERDSLRRELTRQASAVADAAGGFKGLFSRVSAQEEAVLEEIAGAFER
jgi:tellurite resistance protein